jgi:hypothetical protein
VRRAFINSLKKSFPGYALTVPNVGGECHNTSARGIWIGLFSKKLRNSGLVQFVEKYLNQGLVLGSYERRAKDAHVDSI